jgi:signal transduction histidine kinase
MQVEKLYYRLVWISILLCHLFAGVQFWLKRSELEAPTRWIGQFYFLLMFSLLLSILLFLYRERDIAGKIYFVVKLIVFILIGYGEGGYLGVEFTLLTLFIIEISAYFSLIQSIVITFAITTITLVNQRAIEAWNVTLSGVSINDLFSLTIYVCIVSVFANGLHAVVKKLDFQTQVADRLDKAVSQLMDANMGFQEYAVTASKQSVAHERRRISRDIHDTAVHILVNIIMLAESAVDLIAPEHTKLSGILHQIIAQAKEAVRDTRQALRELRAIEEASPKGLKAIYQVVKVFEEATGVQVNINFGNLPWELNQEIDQVLYRMIQEGLTNAFRHGKATQIDIRLWIFEIESRSELIVRIHDNGQGAVEIKKGIGLQGMEERIQKFHGRFEAKNVSHGFEIAAWIPLHNHEVTKTQRI